MTALTRASRALFGALAGAQVGYAFVPVQRRVPATRAIVALMLAVSTTEAAAARGKRRGPALVAGAGALGFAAELAGVATGKPFGHYTYSGKLGPRVRGVPLAAAAAWAMMARPAWVVAGLISRRRPVRDRAGGGRADGVGCLPRPADGARGLLDLAGRGALRGHSCDELRRLAVHGRRGVRRLGARRR